ncbi:MAG TPA: adenylate/guanylate cyclase domain-containing protein [Stellaceae bacterium]|nr:adenylate/guanylate cyclase domain-containing protein [Stellaceae bacterium]
MADPSPVLRHLAAILAADVAGYSRLMGADEEGTLARLKALRAELVDPAIAVHRGRIVKTTGDGLLVEFASVVDALRCAIAWQTAMLERDEKRIQFRIGINLGDIISDGDDIFGDGVNIAARLEAMAEPGGICIESAVLAQTRGKLEFLTDDLGEQALKNIAQPVHVFRVGVQRSRPGARDMPAPQSGPPALPEKPSLAVLPFQNMSGDPEQEYFSDGMVEDITTAIARVPWLFVVARNSSFAYKGKSPDLRQVGRELGVRYVLEGSVRKAGNRVRITGQLIDTTTGGHLWADRIDGGLDDIFELQDRVASSVVGAIEPRLRLAEIERAVRKPPQSLDVHDLYWRALAQFHKSTAESFRETVRLLQEALAIDPSYAPAAALLGQCRTWQRANGWEPVTPEAAAEVVALAKQAADSGRDDPDVLWMAGWTISYLSGDHATGLSLIARALTLNVNSALAWCAHGIVLAYANRPEPAIESLNQAMRLSPLDPLGYLFKAGFTLAHMLAGRYDEALTWVEETLREKPGLSSALRWKASIYGYLGRVEEGRALVQELLAQRPGLTVKRFERYRENAYEITTIFMEGLRKAGLPEE